MQKLPNPAIMGAGLGVFLVGILMRVYAEFGQGTFMLTCVVLGVLLFILAYFVPTPKSKEAA